MEVSIEYSWRSMFINRVWMLLPRGRAGMRPGVGWGWLGWGGGGGWVVVWGGGWPVMRRYVRGGMGAVVYWVKGHCWAWLVFWILR